MAFYETTFIGRQDLAPTEFEKLMELFAGIIKQGGGSVVRSEYWGLRALAYRIKKFRKGHYGMLAINAPYAAVKEMERTMGINEDVVRVLTIAVDALDETPSVMMQKGGREDGDAEEIRPAFGGRP